MTATKYYLLSILIGSIIVLTLEILYLNNVTTVPIPTSTTSVHQKNEITFMFAGDAMFGRAVYSQFHDNLTDAFQNLDKDFFQGDITMLNLEGSMVKNEFVPDTNPNNLIMKFPPQTKDVLLWLGINSVSLGLSLLEGEEKEQIINNLRKSLGLELNGISSINLELK